MKNGIKIILIDLNDNLNSFDYDFMLHLTPSDIKKLKLIEDLLRKYFKRPWAYVGSDKPFEAKKELLDEIEKTGLKEKEEIKQLVTEKKLPAEVLVVLEEGDAKGLHSHALPTSGELQLEQYIVPDSKEMTLQVSYKGKVNEIRIKGPSIVAVGDVFHNRTRGECFIIKFPCGQFKKTKE